MFPVTTNTLHYNKKKYPCKVQDAHVIIATDFEQERGYLDMKRKVAVITGASRGIGRAIAIKYGQKGYHIAICCHSQEEKLRQTADEIQALGAKCITFVGDMGSEKNVERFFQTIHSQYGQIDILVNNAGISHMGLLQDMAPEEWDRIHTANLRSVFLCSRSAIPEMLSRHSGKILSISSVWGKVGASMEVAYSTTKGAINAFTRALAKELAPSGIQVNAIACGMIDTDMNHCLSSEEIATIEEEIPAGRMGTPQEVAELAYQINENNEYLTGQVITLDGGWI